MTIGVKDSLAERTGPAVVEIGYPVVVTADGDVDRTHIGIQKAIVGLEGEEVTAGEAGIRGIGQGRCSTAQTAMARGGEYRV